MKAIIIGDSHTGALKLAADILQAQKSWPQDYQLEVQRLGSANSMVAPYFIDKGDYVEITDENLIKHIQRLPYADEGDQPTYYGFAGPLYAGRLWRQSPYWLNFTPFASQSNQAPVSESLLRHVVFQEQAYTMQLIDVLKRLGVKLFAIEAPKPYKHHPVLESVDPKVVAYIDAFYKKIMTDWLTSRGIPAISVPSHCYGTDGFMHESFKNDDGIHANKEFGIVMIHEVIAFLKSQG